MTDHQDAREIRGGSRRVAIGISMSDPRPMTEHERRQEDAFAVRLSYAKEVHRILGELIRAEVEQTVPIVVWRVGPKVGERVARNTLWRWRSRLGFVSGRGNNQHQAKRKRTGRRDSKAALLEVRP